MSFDIFINEIRLFQEYLVENGITDGSVGTVRSPDEDTIPPYVLEIKFSDNILNIKLYNGDIDVNVPESVSIDSLLETLPCTIYFSTPIFESLNYSELKTFVLDACEYLQISEDLFCEKVVRLFSMVTLTEEDINEDFNND